MPQFLADYLKFNENNECPSNYHIWAALAVLSSVVSRKIWIDQGYFEIRPNLYICLVGKQGNRKTTAKDIAYDLLREVVPNLPVSAESMSKEAITQFMAGDDQLRSYNDETGQIIEYRPFTIFATELKNFLSINPITMVDFLTTIYDRKFYDVITKNKGTDIIVNPYVVFFACETPEWIVARLKESVISGGFARRVVFVNEIKYGQRIAFPTISDDSKAAWLRVKEHLTALKDVVGRFEWDNEAKAFYSNWYTNLKVPNEPLMEGFYNSKHIQVLKIAMLVAVCDRPFKLILTKAHIEVALQIVDAVEVNMPRLSESVGKNELSHIASKLCDILESAGGIMGEKDLKVIMFRDLQGNDYNQVIEHLVRAEKIFKVEKEITTGVKKQYWVSPAWKTAQMEKGKLTK